MTSYLGNGIVFPIQLTHGKPSVVTGTALIQSSIRGILAWSLGDRLLMGHFGSRLSELIEEPNSHVLQGLLRYIITDAIAQWETRVTLVEMIITSPTPSSCDINLLYRIVGQQPIHSFVYPFNLQ